MTAPGDAGSARWVPALRSSVKNAASRPGHAECALMSRTRRGMRRSADALKAPTYVEDKDSGELRRPHHIDLKTGMYRGRQVLTKKSEA